MKTCHRKLHQYPKELRKCPECSLKAIRDWKKTNKEKVLNDKKRWYQDNREHAIKVASDWRNNNPEKVKKIKAGWTSERKRDRDLKKKYGIDFAQYSAMLVAQGNVCALCKKPETAKCWRTGKVKYIPVDHNHANGKIRGLLCHMCNAGLGCFLDNPAVLRAPCN